MSADKAQREYKEAARDIDRHQKVIKFITGISS